ncbi:MAG: SAM-dependent methyltransferase [Sciscionella sp.]
MEQEPSERAELNTARIRDYWLDGTHNTEADREFADDIVVCAPHLPYVVRTHREFLRRTVGYLVAAGVRQFLDLGSGLPTAGNVHEAAQGIDADCRVVYVDIDPAIVDEGRTLLVGNDNTCFVCADVRRPEQVLDAPELRGLLDLDEPVGVLMIDLLHHIPDSDNPAALVAAYTEAVCSDSYLALSQFGEDERLLTGLTVFSQMFDAPPSVTLRDPEQVAGFVTGLDLVEPGIVPIPLWRPEPEHGTDRNPEMYQVYAAVARTP